MALSLMFLLEAEKYADAGDFRMAIICVKNATCCIDMSVRQILEADDLIHALRVQYLLKLRAKD